LKKVFFISLIFTSVIFSCEFDTDCEVGSQCIKSSGSLYGICAGGVYPGNNYDEVPVKGEFDLDGTYGNTCSFDIDCGINNKCYKENGSINGVCVKG